MSPAVTPPSITPSWDVLSSMRGPSGNVLGSDLAVLGGDADLARTIHRLDPALEVVLLRHPLDDPRVVHVQQGAIEYVDNSHGEHVNRKLARRLVRLIR